MIASDLVLVENINSSDDKQIYILDQDGFAFILSSNFEINQKESKAEDIGKGRLVFKSLKKEVLKFHYLKISEKLYLERMITFANGRMQTDFASFRGIEISEFIEKTGNIIISMYLNGYMFIFEKECKKYSVSYYQLYATALSLIRLENNSREYKDELLKEVYDCIIRNGVYIYEEYKLDIIHYNPLNLSLRIKNEQLLDYLETEVSPKFKIFVPSRFISNSKSKLMIKDEMKEKLISKIKDRISELSV